MREVGLERLAEYRQGYLIPTPLYPPGQPIQITSVEIYEAGQGTWAFREDPEGEEGYRVIFERYLGRSRAIFITFDLASSIYSLTHGADIILRPGKSIQGVPRVDLGRRVEEGLRLYPQADMLRRILIHLLEISLPSPLPRIWYFPWMKTGAISFTHDTDNVSQSILEEICRKDQEWGIEATVFLRLVDGRPWQWKRLEDYGIDLQFHPVFLYHHRPGRIIQRLQERIGSSPWVISLQRWGFILQKRLLELLLNKRLVAARSHGLVWNRLTDQPVWMQENGIEIDSTLGSNYYWGYLYGTGLPYFLRRPDSMENLNVLEMPLHIMDSSLLWEYGKEGRPFQRALQDISSFIDQVLPLFPSHLVVDLHFYWLGRRDEDQNSSHLYRALIERCRERDLLFTNLKDFNQYWRKRLKVRLRDCRWDQQNRTVSFRIDDPEGVAGLCCLLPARFQGLHLQEIDAPNPNPTVRGMEWLGQRYLLYEPSDLDREGQIKVRYG